LLQEELALRTHKRQLLPDFHSVEMAPSAKRRKYTGKYPKLQAMRVAARPRIMGRAGSVRTGGFYGRYNGRSRMTREVKFFDTNLSFLVDTTGEVPATGQLTLIPQGVTQSQRIGRECVIKSIVVKGVCQLQPGALAGQDVARVRLMLDTQCNGAAAAVTDVLVSADMSISLTNMSNSKRFRCLKEWNFVFNATAGAVAALAPQIKNWEFYKKCNIPVEYSGTTGAITEIRSNNLFLLAGCSTATDDTISVAGTCRLRFEG